MLHTRTHTHTHTHTHTNTHRYIQGWKLAVSHHQLQITFRVIANHFGKVICQIFLALRITFGRLCVTFQMDSPRDLFFGPHSFFRQNFLCFREILCIRCKNANKLQIMCHNC